MNEHDMREKIEAIFEPCPSCDGMWINHHDGSRTVCSHVEKMDKLNTLLTSEIEKAKFEAYNLLFWKYKELNGQTVDRKFVEAYNALTEEILQEEQ